MKIDLQHIISGLALGVLSWSALQVYEMNAQVSLVSYKVDQNYHMIKPMWQDFLVRQVMYDESGTDGVSNIQASRGEE
jgi:hypothetical protein|tara:strand:+ start:255 stop:488 length:234 start_codon:yes stop_codon:yes gene_type:complete